jgi:hypothetical protein
MPGPAPSVYSHVGDAAGELDHFQAPLDVALAIGHHLAVLGAQELGQLLHPRLHQALELEHHPRPPLRVGGGPGRLGPQGGLDREVQLGGGRQGDPGLNLPGIGVEDVAETARGSRKSRAVDEVLDVAHGGLLGGSGGGG